MPTSAPSGATPTMVQGPIVDGQDVPERCRGALELPGPQPLADDHARGAGVVLGLRERAAGDWMDADEREQTRADFERRNPERFPGRIAERRFPGRESTQPVQAP